MVGCNLQVLASYKRQWFFPHALHRFNSHFHAFNLFSVLPRRRSNFPGEFIPWKSCGIPLFPVSVHTFTPDDLADSGHATACARGPASLSHVTRPQAPVRYVITTNHCYLSSLNRRRWAVRLGQGLSLIHI